MSLNSHYDHLHDLYHQIRTTKSGTRYEILAAVVFAAYEQDAIVIHDLRLIGEDTGVPHQIDVVVERAGKPFRVLIECKDYDISGDDVGLAIVRDFYGVVDDIHPDAAWIITCNGFTADARAYAKGKGIRLATLRLFQDTDWSNGRINTIGIDFTFVTPDPGMILTLKTINEADQGPILAELPPSISLDQVDHTELHDGQCTRSLADILRSLSTQPVLPGSTRHIEARADLVETAFEI